MSAVVVTSTALSAEVARLRVPRPDQTGAGLVGRSANRWGCDIDACLARTCRGGGIAVSHAAVLASVRSCLPAAMTLADFVDGEAPVVDLLTRAAAWLRDDPQGRRANSVILNGSHTGSAW